MGQTCHKNREKTIVSKPVVVMYVHGRLKQRGIDNINDDDLRKKKFSGQKTQDQRRR